MVLPLSRSLHVTFVAMTIVILMGAVFGVLAQEGVQEPPLFRNEATSEIGGHKPNDILASLSNPVWIPKENAIAFNLHYRCITGYTSTGQALDPNCNMGEAVPNGPFQRQVTLYYNTTGSEPQTDEDPSITLTSPVTASLNFNSLQFSGSLPATALDGMSEGEALAFMVEVALAGVNFNCDGTQRASEGAVTCYDTRHTTQEPFYQLRIDDSTPEIVVSDPSNANALRLTDTEWFLYSNLEMSNRLPSIVVSVVDNLTGAPLDEGSIQLFRDRSDNTTNFVRTKVTDWGYSYSYSYSQTGTGARSFQMDTATRIDVLAKDSAGHTLDTRTRTNPAVWVVMDNTTPVLTVDNNAQGSGGSNMWRQPGAEGLAALGEPMRVYINATDVAGRKSDNSLLNTPRELLTVTMRFQGGPDNQTFSDPITIPFNATACTGGCFHSANASIPMEWVNGVTYANVTVTDPVGRSVTRSINGTVNVDIAAPQIVPLRPIDDTISSDFTSESQVTFEARATDPGDEDDWDGADTVDTDLFGVDLDNVRVRYMVGLDGVLRSGKMNPQEADATFRWINTFGSEAAVYYFFEAHDLAGNVARYPAAGDEHVLLNVTQNDGRFLFLQVDQRGPSIEPAVDLNWLGQGPHELSFAVTDGGVGVDEQTVKLFWRPGTSGAFQEVQLIKDPQNETVYKGNIPTQGDGDQVQYYVAAADTLGNANTLGSVGSPRSARIDLTAPTVTVNAPETTSQPRFNVTWTATDTGSGVRDYTLQFRIAPGGAWFTVPARTETALTFYELCAATDKTYEFRVSARDRAGNERAFPETADASTFVDAASSCAQAPDVTITDPTQGATLSGAIEIAWSAVSTTSPGDLNVHLLVGTGSDFLTIEEGLDDQGSHTWNSAALDVTVLCVPDGQYTIRVVAADPNGLEGNANVGPVTIENGISDCDDRDHDGLPDAWEVAQFGDLSQGPDGDADDDGFSNLQEFLQNTDPNDDESHPNIGGNGNNGPISIAGWSNAYILVILAFVAVLAVFVIGMTRRW